MPSCQVASLFATATAALEAGAVCGIMSLCANPLQAMALSGTWMGLLL